MPAIAVESFRKGHVLIGIQRLRVQRVPAFGGDRKRAACRHLIKVMRFGRKRKEIPPSKWHPRSPG